ncbi:MAG: NUDIX hydrolase [Bacteroidota bacterium]
MSTPISPFSHNVRCRVCGLLKSPKGLLMIKHAGLGPLGYLWAPPGGGIEFGWSVEQALEQEFLEETGLQIRVGEYLFANEYRDQTYHAIELFFEVEAIGGVLQLGYDPELPEHAQMIAEVAYLSDTEISAIPSAGKHNIFRECVIPSNILGLRGFYRFANN